VYTTVISIPCSCMLCDLRDVNANLISLKFWIEWEGTKEDGTGCRAERRENLMI